ncbi:hypothetical protein BC351_02545 [Paenibacillus ferrarius]|uniref:Sortilin N-terminal domain-containing protein n=1 Tax=Paenibacillus ferrarius TaxID=1469647 RepID=A0A1V4HUD1_9BACL|nr:hypothetical protein [Paenibacillus ferrarius]OPH62133.1 hypothetical protein BC351_02545 [Paenibacillus ferrarius]
MKIYVIIQTMVLAALLAAGCDHSIPENVPTSQQTPETKPAQVVLEGFPMPLTSGNRIYFYHEGDMTGWTIDRPPNASVRTGLQVYRTDTRGGNWAYTQLPIEQSWEAEVDRDHLLTSLHQNGPSLIMLQSEPKENLTRKTLYRSEDNGTTWTFDGDLTSSISGEVASMMIQEDGIGYITSSYKMKDVIPFYRTTDSGKSWIVQEFPHQRDFQFAVAYPPELGEDGVGTVRVDYTKEQGTDSVYYETTDNGSNWHLFETASILRFHGDPAALDTIKRFADHWLAQDEQKVGKLLEVGASVSWITSMKTHRYTFIRAYPPSNEPDQDQLCVGLQYQTDVKDDPAIGTMAVCVRKQKSSNEWRVYMLD